MSSPGLMVTNDVACLQEALTVTHSGEMTVKPLDRVKVQSQQAGPLVNFIRLMLY